MARCYTRGSKFIQRLLPLTASPIVLVTTSDYSEDRSNGNSLAEVKIRKIGPVVNDHLHNYTSEEVSRHDSDKTGVWVTYRDGVYDVTKFLDQHPGGRRFLLSAAGTAVDGLWQFWHYHHASDLVARNLEQYRIGTLSDWEEEDEISDLYMHDPERSTSKQSTLLDRPYSSQTKNKVLSASYLTPSDALYIRNHGPVPYFSSTESIMLDVAINLEESAPAGTKGLKDTADESNTERLAAVSLKELQDLFGTKKVTSVLQCGGSRAREDLSVNGLSGFAGTNYESITSGMIGNVCWEGIPLAPLLRHYFSSYLNVENAYLEFHGADQYFSSVPLSQAIDPRNDCLLAVKMNGAPLPPDHGAPFRIVLPGYIGARSVKWLRRIVVRTDEGLSPWNAYYYNDKSLPKKNFTFQSGHDIKLQSLILESEVKANDYIYATGIAYSGNGHKIQTVEVSADLGRSWHTAKLKLDDIIPDDASESWHWLRWHAMIPTTHKFSKCPPRKHQTDSRSPPPDDVNVPVLARGPMDPSATFIKTAAPPPADTSLPQLWCRASTANETQPPDSVRRGGYNFNGYHRVYVEPPSPVHCLYKASQ